ncbi:MAG: PIG-L family deacetylase [Actinomycetota bacterium]|nr:PIG-L family deacetylase [Actinomycetota bacterium]
MSGPTPPTLEPLAEDWQRALAIVAHPDDMEYGAAAAVARWTGQGKQLVYCMVTSGEAGMDTVAPEQARQVREAEQVAAAAVVGVNDVEFLGFPDGVVEYGLPLRRALARTVRLHRPDIVLTTNFRDTYGGLWLNQADHIAVGRATVDAVRDAANRWVFRELLDEGLQRWAGVRQVWAAGSPNAKHAADTTGTFEAGVASLEAHTAYLAALGDAMGDAREFLEAVGRSVGTGLGTRYAAAFEVLPIRAG